MFALHGPRGRRSLLAAALLPGLAVAGPPAEIPAPKAPVAAPAPAPAPAPTEPVTPAGAAREAYNAGRYAEAATGFLAAVQETPEDAELYRALARARVYATDQAGAVVAYRFYLELAPGAQDSDKVQAELDHALALLPQAPPVGPPAGAAKVMAEARRRGEAGDVAGALDKLAEALAKGYFSPKLGAERAALLAPLTTAWQAELGKFLSPEATVDPEALDRIRNGFARLSKARGLNVAEAAAAGGASGLLAYKAGKYDDAVLALTPCAPADPRLRMAQALALLHLGRAEEAASGLSSLTGQLSDAGDRRILAFVLGIARRAAGLDPTSALREALDLEAPNGPSGP